MLFRSPGAEGDFGVLKGHAPLISRVRPGVIDVHDGGAVAERLFVSGGFAEVSGERCTVLADSATPLADIDRAASAAELKALQVRLAAADGEAEREALGGAIAVAEARLAALGEA